MAREGKGNAPMKKNIFLTVSITLFTAVNSQIWALELGDLTTYSGFNEPLNAEIVLLEVDGLRDEDLYVGLASANEFASVGMTRNAYLAGINFGVEIGEGVSRVLLMSQAPLREPDLQFVVEARWPEGRLLRDYKVLIDFPPQTPSEPSLPREQSLEKPASFSGYTGDDAGVNQQFGREVSDRPSPGGSYLVTSSDTLWSIASSVAGPGVSVEQTMLEIVATNPHAFLDGNVNRLESGYVLELPEEGEVQVELAGALDAVAKQNAAWTESTKGARQGLTLVAKNELIEVDMALGVDAAVSKHMSPLEPASKVAFTGPLDVSRSEIDVLTTTVGELQMIVAQLQSQLTERDMQLVELRAVLSARDAVLRAAPIEQPTSRTWVSDFLSEPVWLFVTGCVAIVSALLTLAAMRRRQDLGSQSDNGRSVMYVEATGTNYNSGPGQVLKPDTFTESCGRSMRKSGLSQDSIPSHDEQSTDVSALSVSPKESDLAIDSDTISTVDSIYGAETDPIDSKLDLARAYIDMGDDESARPVLQEVMQQGDFSQQAEAIELLRRIEDP